MGPEPLAPRRGTPGVDIVHGGGLYASSDRSRSAVPDERRIDLIGCRISEDASRAVRSTSQISLVGSDRLLVPDSSRHPFAPTATTYVRPWVDIDQVRHILGHHLLDAVSVERIPGGVAMEISGLDRFSELTESAFYFEQPRIYASGRPIPEIIREILATALTGATLNISSGNFATLSEDLTLITGDSRGAVLEQLAEAAGLEIFLDRKGEVVAAPPPVLDSRGLASVVIDSGTIISATRNLSRSSLYNGVVVRGESPGTDIPPVEAAVWNSRTDYLALLVDENSPESAHLSPRPLIINADLAETEEQARAIAADTLPGITGYPESATIVIPLDPAITVNQLVDVVDDVLGLHGVWATGRVDHDLAIGTTTITTVERRASA